MKKPIEQQPWSAIGLVPIDPDLQHPPIAGESGWWRLLRLPDLEAGEPAGRYGGPLPIVQTPSGGIHITARIIEGQVTGLLLTSPGAINSTDVRKIKVPQVIGQYAAQIFGDPGDVRPRERERSGPMPVSADEISEFVATYLKHREVQPRRATQATAEELNISTRTARRRIEAAKEAGLLEGKT